MTTVHATGRRRRGRGGDRAAAPILRQRGGRRPRAQDRRTRQAGWPDSECQIFSM